MPRELRPQNVFMDRFVLEPKVQRVWDVPHATWFTLMGVGGGLFILARLFGLEADLGRFLGLPVVDLVSFLAIAVGGVILIADLGRPLRFLRAVLNPRTSWISRGAIADIAFLALGGLLVLPDLRVGGAAPFSFFPWDARAGSPPGLAIEVAAMVSAAVVTFYAGQVLAEPRAIPYWNSPAVPLQFVASSAATSLATVMLLAVASGRDLSGALFGSLALSLAVLAGLVVGHLRTRREVPGKSHSLEALTRGRYRAPFLGGVLLAGTVLPLALALTGMAVAAWRGALGVLCFALLVPAGFLLRLITLRVGIFPPVRSVLPASAARAG
jgi:formate-dependent nitrite reductase membrane component NrfD